MKFYTLYTLEEEQLVKKYIKELNNSINAIMHFIDTFNPNYKLLNTPAPTGKTYFTDDQLANLGILDQFHSTINPEAMKPHYVINNSYGHDYTITGTSELIPQGYAVRHDGYNSDGETEYSIISLASSGTFYVIQDFVISSYSPTGTTCNITWQLQDNATDNFGQKYVFSLTIPGTRFYYHQGSSTLSFAQFLAEPPYIYPAFGQVPADVFIGTSTNGVWTSSHLLIHEVYTETSINNLPVFEDTFDDTTVTIEQTRVGEYPQSRYTINTNIKDLNNQLRINFY